jgi:hypothetical protein
MIFVVRYLQRRKVCLDILVDSNYLLDPAGFAEAVAALESSHAGVLILEKANVAVLHH